MFKELNKRFTDKNIKSIIDNLNGRIKKVEAYQRSELIELTNIKNKLND